VPKKISIKDCREIANSKEGCCLSVEYQNALSKLIWKCKEDHVWEASWFHVKTNNCWCPHCHANNKADNIKKTIEVCREIANSKEGYCLSKKYKNSHSKLTWKCKEGHVWENSLKNIKNENQWCPYCYGNVRNKIEDCHRLAKKKDGQCLSSVYVNNRTKYSWKCCKGHVWEAKYNDIQRGQWCPHCANNIRKTIGDCREVAKKRNGECVSSEYVNNHENLLWRCDKGHEWIACFHAVNDNGTWCPVCGKKSEKLTKIKKYGVDNIFKSKEFQKKIKQTNMKKYGVGHPMQNHEVALKSARTANQITNLRHWFSNETVPCRGSYEVAVVNYLNKNKIDYLWQPQTFLMSDERTYTPDLYLVEEDKWVEIKGYFWGDAKEKWDRFCNRYKNSELWNRKKLEKRHIL